MNTSSRQYFVRNNFQSHSFHGRTAAFGAGFHRPMFKPFSPKKVSKLLFLTLYFLEIRL
ncbi:hypothetical protein NECAME_12932 [Necator americanus]|uniref:Uncharacterized protein n=1 Tax=Necator americanus TaxID=51031 RepID=W2T0J0_NECAM|nr:hypothetical protein NECAME_12932 [Necator americanus]ETN74487.1 hypothetical protein NECAME_12932 [Necator americanus]